VALARSRSSFVVHQPPCPQAPPGQCRTDIPAATAPTARLLPHQQHDFYRTNSSPRTRPDARGEWRSRTPAGMPTQPRSRRWPSLMASLSK